MPSKRTYHVRTSKDFLVVSGVCFFMCLWAVRDAWFPSDKVLKKHPRAVSAAYEIDGMIEEIYVKVGDLVNERQVLAELNKTRLEEFFNQTRSAFTDAKSTYEREHATLQTARKASVTGDELNQLIESVNLAEAIMKEKQLALTEANEKLGGIRLVSPAKGRVIRVDKAVYDLVQPVHALSSGKVVSIEKDVVTLQDASGKAIECVIGEGMSLNDKVIVGTAVIENQVLAGDSVVMINPTDHFYPFNQTLAVAMFVGFWLFLGLHLFAT